VIKPALPRPMPMTRLRPAAARAPGGASSLLRLSAGGRLPSGASLGDWIDRAAQALRGDEPALAFGRSAV
jgi:hypothetical protein